MSRWSKFYDKLAAGQADNNIDFEEVVSYLERLGWETGSSGRSHRFFKHALVPAAIDVQPRSDDRAKA